MRPMNGFRVSSQSGTRTLILTLAHIIASNQRIAASFCSVPYLYNLLMESNIIIALEFDTVARSRLVYHSNVSR